MLEVFRQQVELEQSGEDFFILALDVVKELAHHRWSELALDSRELTMNPIELAFELIQLGSRVDGTLDSDLVDKLFQSFVKGLKIVGVGHRSFAEVLEHPAEELVKGPQRSEAVGQCGIPNAQGMCAGSLHHLRIHRLAVTDNVGEK